MLHLSLIQIIMFNSLFGHKIMRLNFMTFYYLLSVTFSYQSSPIKLRQLTLPNRIVDDSDSKLSKFECRFWSNWKSDNTIISYWIVSISFWLNLTNFWLKSIYYQLNWPILDLRIQKSQLKDRKIQWKD